MYHPQTDEEVTRWNARIDADRAKRKAVRIALKARALDCLFFIAIGFGLSKLIAFVF